MSEYLDLIKNLGLPTALLLLLLWGLALGLRAIWRYLQPFIAAWFAEQIKLLESLRSSLAELAVSSKADADGHRTTHTKIDDAHADIRAIKERIPPLEQHHPKESHR